MFYLSKNMNYPKMDEGKNQKMPSMTSRRASKQSIQMVDQPPTSVGVQPMGRTQIEKLKLKTLLSIVKVTREKDLIYI